MSWMYMFNYITFKILALISAIGVTLLCIFLRYRMPYIDRYLARQGRTVDDIERNCESLREKMKVLTEQQDKIKSELKKFKESFTKNNYEMIFMPQSELV